MRTWWVLAGLAEESGSWSWSLRAQELFDLTWNVSMHLNRLEDSNSQP